MDLDNLDRLLPDSFFLYGCFMVLGRSQVSYKHHVDWVPRHSLDWPHSQQSSSSLPLAWSSYASVILPQSLIHLSLTLAGLISMPGGLLLLESNRWTNKRIIIVMASIMINPKNKSSVPPRFHPSALILIRIRHPSTLSLGTCQSQGLGTYLSQVNSERRIQVRWQSKYNEKMIQVVFIYSYLVIEL